MKTRVLCILQILLMALCTPKVQSQSRLTESQADQIFSQWNKNDIPGVSLAVVSNGKVIFSKGYGLSNLEYNIPSVSSTVYQVASVSKQVTAFAVLLLESRGKLSLNDNLAKFIPEMPEYAKSITLKHLLYHTSGLRDYWELLSSAGWRYDDVITADQVLDLICRQKGLTSRPGYEEIYTNTGYALLAEVVSRVSGMSFAEFARENIFKPLKMNHTAVLDNNEAIVKNVACSYHLSDGVYKKSLLNNNVTGSTNLFTTVDDMSLWALNLEKPVVGSPEMIHKMTRRGTLDSGDSTNYAMGLDTGPYRGVMLVGHQGAEAGYRSFFAMFPAHKLTLIVFSNNAEADPAALGLEVADLVLKDKFPPEDISQITAKPATAQAQPDFAGNKNLLALCAGRYELRPGYVINITSEDEGLYAEAHEVPKSRLVRTSEKEFTLPMMRAKLTFAGDDPASVSRMLVELNGQQMVAPKLKPFEPSSVSTDELTGDFYSHELRTIYTFVTKDKQLVVKQLRMEDVKLQATAPDQFSIDKRRVEFVRGADNKITGFMFSSGRIRNIWFQKI